MNSWKKTKKWTMSEVRNLSFSDLSKMKLPERADLAQYLTEQYRRRVRESMKAGEMPYGLEKLRKNYSEPSVFDSTGEHLESLSDRYGYSIGDNITRRVKGMTMLTQPLQKFSHPNQHLLGYISMMITGLKWESSTLAGWEKIKSRQDIMLFGGHYEMQGKRKVFVPNQTMDYDTRTMFWRAIDELRKRGSTALDYEHSDPLTDTDFTTFFSEGKVDWSDLTSVTNALESFLNGDKLSFPEYAPGDKADPFGQVGAFGKDGLENDDSL